MKRKSAICISVILIMVLAAVCGALAGCGITLTADEGAQAVLDALDASKAFLTDYDKAEGYRYYTKFSTLSADGKSSETYYLNYQLGDKDRWEDFLFIRYTSTITTAGTSVTASEYLGDVLPMGKEDAKENYIRVYTDGNKAAERMSEEEFLGREDIRYLTLEYIFALFDNLTEENIEVSDASVSGSVTTVTFSVQDESVPLSTHKNVTVRILNDKITSLETYETDASSLTLDYAITYYAPNGSMPEMDYEL